MTTMMDPSMSELAKDERSVLRVLRHHQGRASAVGLMELSRLTGVPTRHVQDVVAHLVERHGVPIGSAVKKPMGYFLIESQADREESLAQLMHRIRALAKRIAALQRSTTPIVLQQLAMDLEANGEAV